MQNKKIRNPNSAIRNQLAEDDQIVLQQQGAYLSGRSWKLGHLYLTDKRLLFSKAGPAGKLVLDVPLSNVARLAFVKRPFILVTKPCLCLSYRDGASGRVRQATIITANLEAWARQMTELLAEEGVELEMPGVMAAGDAAQARRDRVQEILAEIHAEEQAVAEGIKTKEEIAQERIDRILGQADERMGAGRASPARQRVREILAEVQAQREARASEDEQEALRLRSGRE